LETASAHSPTHAWFAEDVATVSDQYLYMSNPVTVTGDAELRFWHHYSTESYFDGGVVEISADGGSWTDLGSLITQNGYNSTISPSYSSPIAERQVFSGSSGGYVETIVDLSSYAGSSVQIRFRMATDISVSSVGWYVDDVEILDEYSVTNTACVEAVGEPINCDTIVTRVNANPTNPQIIVSPTSLTGTQFPNESTNQILTISNTGGSDLEWTIDESADACTTTTEVPWVSATPTSGTTPPGGADNVTVTFATGLSPGPYTGFLCVTSNNPGNDVETVDLTLTVQDPATTVEQLATADFPVAGTVVGTFNDTHHDDDGTVQEITERDSGGKPSKRHDYLEHKWTFEVELGSAHTFYVNAWRTENSDGDDFVFAYSTDDNNYANMVTVTAASEGSLWSYELPAGLSGTVYVRVRDMDQTARNRQHDTVFVDHMVIETQLGGNPPPNENMHVGDLDGSSSLGNRGRWEAVVTITVHDGPNEIENENPIRGVTVYGTWSNGASGGGSCIIGDSGQCSITKGNIKKSASSVTFTVDDLSLSNYTYSSDDNHDPDGDSNGTFIVIYDPQGG